MKYFLALFVTLLALVLSNSALVNSVSLTSEFEHQNRYISVNGSSTFSTLMSGSFDTRFHAGETSTGAQTPFLPGIANGVAQATPNSACANLVLNTPLSRRPGYGSHALIAYSPVPEPGSLTLLGTGLIGLAALLRRKSAIA